MKLRPPLATDAFSDGFTQQNDLFQQVDLARRLTGLIRALTQGSVSVLDGRWGTGKTTFVKMWTAELERAGIPAIYFDAFSFDFIQDPFQAVSAAFIKAASDRRQIHDPRYKQYLDKTAAVAKRIAVVATKAGVKLATLGALTSADVEALSADIEKELSSSAGDLSSEGVKILLEQQATAEQTFAELRRSLSTLPDLFSTSEERANVPLVVVIDELDRCRPDFALGVVETLKHFFRVERLHFVLVTNLSFLELSVAHRYGVSDAASEYLQKFYDYVIHFEQSFDRNGEGSATRYVDYALSKVMVDQTLNRDRRELADDIKAIATAYRLTLRQIEGVVTNVAIALLAASEREFRPHILVSFLCGLKLLEPEIYKSVKRGKLSHDKFDHWIDRGDWSQSFDKDRIKSIFRYYSDPNLDLNDPKYSGWGNELWSFNLARERVLTYLSNSVIDRFGRPEPFSSAIEA